MGNVHSFSVTMLKYRSVLQVLQWNFGVFRWFFMAEDLQRASRTADIIAVLRLPVKINAILCLGMRSFKGMFYCCWLGFTTLCMTVNRIISLWTPMPHRYRIGFYFHESWRVVLMNFYMLHESHAFGCFPASAIYASKFYSRCFPVTSITMPSKLLTYTQQSCSYNV